jgi:lipopolysaccharide assembly protein A
VSASNPPGDPLPPEPSESLTDERPAPEEPIARPLGHTRLSATWTVVAASLIGLVLLLVFILLNLQRVEVNLYGAHKQIPLAIALLFAVVFGGVLVFAIGTSRILQVRARAKRADKGSP